MSSVGRVANISNDYNDDDDEHDVDTWALWHTLAHITCFYGLKLPHVAAFKAAPCPVPEVELVWVARATATVAATITRATSKEAEAAAASCFLILAEWQEGDARRGRGGGGEGVLAKLSWDCALCQIGRSFSRGESLTSLTPCLISKYHWKPFQSARDSAHLRTHLPFLFPSSPSPWLPWQLLCAGNLRLWL